MPDGTRLQLSTVRCGKIVGSKTVVRRFPTAIPLIVYSDRTRCRTDQNARWRRALVRNEGCEGLHLCQQSRVYLTNNDSHERNSDGGAYVDIYVNGCQEQDTMYRPTPVSTTPSHGGTKSRRDRLTPGRRGTGRTQTQTMTRRLESLC